MPTPTPAAVAVPSPIEVICPTVIDLARRSRSGVRRRLLILLFLLGVVARNNRLRARNLEGLFCFRLRRLDFEFLFLCLDLERRLFLLYTILLLIKFKKNIL